MCLGVGAKHMHRIADAKYSLPFAASPPLPQYLFWPSGSDPSISAVRPGGRCKAPAVHLQVQKLSAVRREHAASIEFVDTVQLWSDHLCSCASRIEAKHLRRISRCEEYLVVRRGHAASTVTVLIVQLRSKHFCGLRSGSMLSTCSASQDAKYSLPFAASPPLPQYLFWPSGSGPSISAVWPRG